MRCLNDFEQKMWQETRRFILNYLAQFVHELMEAGSERCWGGCVTVHVWQWGCEYSSIYSDVEFLKVVQSSEALTAQIYQIASGLRGRQVFMFPEL